MTTFNEDMESLAPVWILLESAQGRAIIAVADIADPADHMANIAARLARLEGAMMQLFRDWTPLPPLSPDSPPYKAEAGQAWRQVPRKDVKLIEEQLVYVGPREGEV